METFIVYFFLGLKLLCALALLLGWLLAWRFKKRGGGYLLWIIYISCVVIAAALMIIDPRLSSINLTIREWAMSDMGIIAFLNGGRGLRFPAAQSIALINGIQIMGFLFCIISLVIWKIKLKKKVLEELDSEEQNIQKVNNDINIVTEELDISLSYLDISSDIFDSFSLPQKHKLKRLVSTMQPTDLIAMYGNEIKLIDAERWNRIMEQGKSEEFKVIYKKTEFR